MNRRDFLQRAGLIAAGVVAADQIELMDRLGWKRRFFPGFTPTPVGSWCSGDIITIHITDQYGHVLDTQHHPVRRGAGQIINVRGPTGYSLDGSGAGLTFSLG